MVVVPPQHHHFTTTTAIKISCVAIYAVLSQNQLCRDLRVFGVKFLSWKWCRCQKMSNMRASPVTSPYQYARKFSNLLSCFLQPTSPLEVLLSNYPTCSSPILTLSLNWGRLLLEPLFGTPMMATLGSFPQIQIFQTFQTRSKRQNRAGNHTYCPCYFSH